MPIPDLDSRNGEVDASLNKFTVKTDGDEGSFLFSCDIIFVVLNSQEAEELERLIPGSKEIYVRATEVDDWKGQIKVTPVFPAMTLEVALAGSGLSLLKGGAEIEYLLYRASKKIVTLTAKVRFGGQSESVAANLCKGLGRTVSFIWDVNQQALFIAPKNGKKQSVIPKVGQIISGRNEGGVSIFGQVVEVNETDGDVLVTDFGADHQVRFVDVHTAWSVATGTEYDARIKSFKERCKKRDLLPSWEALTQATGEAFGSNEIPGEGQHTITKEIVTRAIEILEVAAKAPAEPPADAPVENVIPMRAQGRA